LVDSSVLSIDADAGPALPVISLTSLTVKHEKATIKMHRRLFFVGGEEIFALASEPEALGSPLMSTIKVSADRLERAIVEVRALRLHRGASRPRPGMALRLGGNGAHHRRASHRLVGGVPSR
jgi:hypothetical protein